MPDNIFMDRFKIVCIYIASIMLYILLNIVLNCDNIQIALAFRIYYIVLCLSLFILLKQIKIFMKQYVSTIILLFLSLIMIACILGFIDNINYNNSLYEHIQYIDLSTKVIVLLELFLCFILSEYYFRNRKYTKLPYLVVSIAIISMIVSYRYKIAFNYVKIAFFIIEILLIVKVFISIRKISTNKKKKYNIIKCCIVSTLFISIIYQYGFYTNKYILIEVIIEIINLANFTIICNMILKSFVAEPYKELANSLRNETKGLDKLNKQIIKKNKELEKSIGVLKNNEYLYSTFFRYMPHPIVIVNLDNERVLFVNKQFLKMSGINILRDIVNEKIDKYIEFLKDDLINKNYNAILSVEGERKFIYTTILPRHLDNGRKIILIKDNTSNVIKENIEKEVRHKKIEENMRRQFLSSISHDLKTPINLIYSASQIEKLYIQKKDFKTLAKYNIICKHNCIYLIKLTNNLIDSSQISSHYLSPRLRIYNLVEIVESSVTLLVEYAKWNDITLIFDTNTEECYLNIDQEFMNRIILNLVANAVKFTGKNGKIHAIISEKDDYVRVSIKDNGIGMKKEFIKKAFNRYEVENNEENRSKSESGIGLFVVKELVELQGGTIWIESYIDIGTNIIMQFKKEK